ncbi:MAG: hypothetical protein V3575_02085 [Candidatus Absconditabacteria bacterium]
MSGNNNGKNNTSSSIFEAIADTMMLGIKEFNKTVSILFSTPKQGRNQITKEMDGWESDLVEKRK